MLFYTNLEEEKITFFNVHSFKPSVEIVLACGVENKLENDLGPNLI